MEEGGIDPAAAGQMVDYLAAARMALGVIPTERTLVIERFFDEAGGMQLVLHAPLGQRQNRALGLALRKRFCTRFNFELQAAATDDAVVLSLSEGQSFPLDEIPGYLNAATVREVLIQALLDVPLFKTRWRWNATISLAVPRRTGARKVRPQLQRILADDLLAAVFPDQAACVENRVARDGKALERYRTNVTGRFAELCAAGRATALTVGDLRLWAAVERLPEILALFPEAVTETPACGSWRSTPESTGSARRPSPRC